MSGKISEWREIVRDMRRAGWRHSVKWIGDGHDADGAPYGDGALEHTWTRSWQGAAPVQSINAYADPHDGTLCGYLSYWPDLESGDPDGVSVSVGLAAASGPDWLRQLMQLCSILPAPSIPSESRSNP